MRRETLAFYLLLVTATGLLGWISQRYLLVWDWSDSARNTLSEASIQLLDHLQAPLQITSFAPENDQLRSQIREIAARYQRHRPDIRFEFVDPARHPARTRELGIKVAGELHLQYEGRSENLRQIDEQGLSNAIQRLIKQGERWVISLEGHGERRLNGEANHDLGAFGAELERKGYRVQPLDLTTTHAVPDNTGVLVIAGPQSNLLPGEVTLILEYLERGGNLLWLLDPGPLDSLQPVADWLGLTPLPGTLVDANAASVGLDDPAMAVVSSYPDHPTTQNFEHLTLYPHAMAFDHEQPRANWETTELLQTLPGSWNETGPIRGEVSRDAGLGEQAGPLTIGLAYARERHQGKQRLVVIGDGDFLSNAYLGNGGNLDLGIHLIRWLVGDIELIDVPARIAPDRLLELSRLSGILIGMGFLIIIPALLALTGGIIWWRRRH